MPTRASRGGAEVYDGTAPDSAHSSTRVTESAGATGAAEAPPARTSATNTSSSRSIAVEAQPEEAHVGALVGEHTSSGEVH